MYLLDTCVLSELVKRDPNTSVIAWLAAASDEALRISVISLGELEHGVERLSEGKRKAQLTQWLEGLHRQYAPRILDVTPKVAREWGTLMARAEANGVTLPVMDGWIAATARVHGYSIATRNVSDFVGVGVPVHDPWS